MSHPPRLLATALVVTVAVFAIATKVSASPYSLDITENSSTSLTISLSLPHYTYDATLMLAPGSLEVWGQNSGNTEWFLQDSGSGAYYPDLYWQEPGNANQWNRLLISPSGNLGTTFLQISSDVGLEGSSDCTNGPSYVACPQLLNGQPIVLPFFEGINGGEFPGQYSGVMTITFTDNGDAPSEVPEPGTLALLGTGLVFGAARWRKRQPTA